MAADRQSRPVVVIVGSVNVDLVVAAERLPGPGETVLGPRHERYGGAMGASAAVAAVGDDALGRKRSRSCATRASTLRE
jgi:ribokinase